MNDSIVMQIIFYFSAIIAVISAIMVITLKNSIKAILFLALTFVFTAIIWIMMEAYFLAIALIFIYVGALLILFIFATIMLNIEEQKITSKFNKNLAIGIFVSIFLILFFSYLFIHSEFNAISKVANIFSSYVNVKDLSHILYENYFLEIEILGIILLLVMVSVIVLLFLGEKPFRKRQDIGQQLLANKKNRLKLK